MNTSGSGLPPTARHVSLAPRPALDGLRALAVSGVMAFHAGVLPGGFLGVDLFFVLSGFLISSLLAEELERDGGLRLGRFWSRRLRRLTPALLLGLLGAAAYAHWLARPVELLRIRNDALSALFYVSNWQALRASQDYWELFQHPSPLLHTWSLGIEGQFYLLWPLVLLGLRRWASCAWGTIAFIAAALAAASAVTMALLAADGDGLARAFYGTDSRAMPLLLGASLACAARALRGPVTPGVRRARELGAWLALLGSAALWALLAGHDPLLYRGGFLTQALLAGALVVAASAREPGPLGRALAWGPLVWLGRISYGLYLWHWPVYLALDVGLPGLGTAPRLLAKLGLSLLVAVASFHLFEQPVRRGAFPGWRAALVGLAAVGAVAWAILHSTTGGLRLSPQTVEAQAPRAPSPAPAIQGLPDRVLVLGDSMAELLGRALVELSPEGTVINRGKAECGLLRGSRRVRLEDGRISRRGPSCPDWSEAWPRAVADTRPEVALLVLGEIAQGDWELEGRWLHACEPEFDRHYQAELGEALQALGELGVVVVVATSAYSQWADKPRWLDGRTDCLNEAIRDAVAAHPWSEVLELQRFVCPSLACLRELEGKELRPDGVHFAGPGARPVARWVLEQLGRLPRVELGHNLPGRP
jgi:peptidoglycan/LPS O-acetylase OafA/YrhL